jgi:hypothetical protein
VNSCRLSRRGGEEFCTGCLISGELSRTPAAVDTTFVAIARALTSSVSDPDSDLDPDLSLVVLVAQPAFWAAVILPRLFSKATALVN